MKSKFVSALVGLLWLVSTPVMAQEPPKMSTYKSVPFWLDGQTIPTVMLVLERDWKMFYPAYNNLADLDGDGALDIGFNPAVTYVGYFDSNSCYKYIADDKVGVDKADSGRFVRDRAASAPQTQAEADAAAAASEKISKSNLAIKPSKHGLCPASTGNGDGWWHGNWLNYSTTSRMDAIRKVLYGGKRWKDDVDKTILEMVYIPGNANVWGGELYADDIWEKYAPSSPWYDISRFTGYAKPGEGEMHFWARANFVWWQPINPDSMYDKAFPSANDWNYGEYNRAPLFRFVANLKSTFRHPLVKTPIRIWDWVGDHSSYNVLPFDGNLAKALNADGTRNDGTWMVSASENPKQDATLVSKNFNARVEVCQKGNISATEGCRSYGENNKPIGLLQQYGESGRMHFGLLTGTLHYESSDPYRTGYADAFQRAGGTRYRGGVVRHRIQKFENYVDPNTGQIKISMGANGLPVKDAKGNVVREGLISTIDGFEITGLESGQFKAYADGTQAGNPVGEMVWEAVRYMASTLPGVTPLAPTGLYVPPASGSNMETKVRTYNSTQEGNTTGTLFQLPIEREWKAGGLFGDCVKPIILVLSEVFPDHDGDNYPNLPDLKDSPVAKVARDANDNPLVPQGLVLNDYLDLITNYEKLTTAASGQKFFFPNSRGLCAPSNLTGGLKSILGHCPSEPSLQGTYNVAAVAYYAHTHNFAAKDDPDEKNIDLYAVGIAGNFPDITLTVDNKRSVALMPIAAASLSAPTGTYGYAASNSRLEGRADKDLKTLLNFFIQYWQTDDGHVEGKDAAGVDIIKKIPYKIKFSVNFEYTTTPCFTSGGTSNNWERDVFNTFTITLLTDTSTPAEYREEIPLFINSGPFRTPSAQVYRQDLAQYNSGQKNAFENSSQENKYYYAFKKSKDKTLDISKYQVKGLVVQTDVTGSGYGAGGLAGYSISGVTKPGSYLDVGFYLADYPVFYKNGISNANYLAAVRAYSSTTAVPGTEAEDEPVPLEPSGTRIPGAKWPFSDPVNKLIHHLSSHVRTNSQGNECGYFHPPTLQDELLTPAECPYPGYSHTHWTSMDPDLQAAYPEYSPANSSTRPTEASICGERSGGNYDATVNNAIELLAAFQHSKTRYTQVRSFKFEPSTGVEAAGKLPNPLWLAAKYGGFKKMGENEVTQQLEPQGWERGGTGPDAKDPYNYFGVANMSQLPAQLGQAFETIANSVGTGTANASSVAMVLGGGISVQTQYRPDYSEKDTPSIKVKWGGSAYAFFMDKWGNFRADTNKNNKLDLVTSPKSELWSDFHPTETIDTIKVDKVLDGEIGDLIVHTVLVPVRPGISQKDLCTVPLTDEERKKKFDKDAPEVLCVYLCRDPRGDNNGGTYLPNDPNDIPKGGDYPPYSDCQVQDSLDSVTALWNAAQKLSDLPGGTIDDAVPDRKIYTYLGKDDPDGLKAWTAESIEAYPFKTKDESGPNLNKLHVYMGQKTLDDTKDLINYIRGHDGDKNALEGSKEKKFSDKFRNRTVILPWDDAATATPKVWRMGDVINSRPVLVGEPSSNFQYLYDDYSYDSYRKQMARRRQVAYFGTNGGMLHAVNLGFFGAIEQGQAGYHEAPLTGADSPFQIKSNWKIGDEMWSFVPPSVLPHLQWLADPDYQHSYYVDFKPYIVDVKNGGEWRTIMIVGLRLGGAPIELINSKDPKDPLYTTPEFFAMDITNPEEPPKLLWRFSDPTLGLTSASPTVVRGPQDNWYVVLPSGPTQLESGIPNVTLNGIEDLFAGRSNQKAKVVVLDVFTGQYARQRDQNPSLAVDDDPLQVEEGDSFFNGSFLPRAKYIDTSGVGGSPGGGWIITKDYGWVHYTLYLSLSATKSNNLNSGAVYRIQMMDSDKGRVLKPDEWELKRFYKTDKPVTAPVNATFDPMGTMWVTFGTGRMWGQNDMTPCGTDSKEPACITCSEQYLFGLKEPVNSDRYMTFEEVEQDKDVIDVSGIKVFENGVMTDRNFGAPTALGGITKYEDLYKRMITTNPAKRVNGYKVKLESWLRDTPEYETDASGAKKRVKPKDLENVFELVDTQVKLDKLLNGRMNAVVTSYTPSDNICNPMGSSDILVYDAFTGLPAPYMAPYGGLPGGQIDGLDANNVATKYNEVTAHKKVGRGMASEAWVLKTEEGTTYGSTGFAGQRVVFRIPQDQASTSGLISWRELIDPPFILDDKSDVLFEMPTE